MSGGSSSGSATLLNIANVVLKLALEMAAHGMVMLQFHKSCILTSPFPFRFTPQTNFS